MKSKSRVILTTVGLLSLAGTASAANTMVPPAAGFPWNDATPMANFARQDNTVCASSSSAYGEYAWMIPFTLYNKTSGSVSAKQYNNYPGGTYVTSRLCRFQYNGVWVNCTNWTGNESMGSLSYPTNTVDGVVLPGTLALEALLDHKWGGDMGVPDKIGCIHSYNITH